MCADHAGDDIPEAMLAGVSRANLTHLVVLISAKLAAAQVSLETLMAELDARETVEEPSSGSSDAAPPEPA